MFHLVSIWLTRLVVVGVAIALLVMYGIPKYFGEPTGQPAAPAATTAAPAVVKLPTPTPVETAAPAAAVPAVKPEGAATSDAAPPATNVDRGEPQPAAAALPRCQPIGRTARGVLVYSMDCRRAAEQ